MSCPGWFPPFGTGCLPACCSHRITSSRYGVSSDRVSVSCVAASGVVDVLGSSRMNMARSAEVSCSSVNREVVLGGGGGRDVSWLSSGGWDDGASTLPTGPLPLCVWDDGGATLPAGPFPLLESAADAPRSPALRPPSL